MRKSITKRVRITRTGKIMRRKMGQGHFRAGKSGKGIRNKRGALVTKNADMKSLRTYAHRLGGTK